MTHSDLSSSCIHISYTMHRCIGEAVVYDDVDDSSHHKCTNYLQRQGEWSSHSEFISIYLVFTYHVYSPDLSLTSIQAPTVFFLLLLFLGILYCQQIWRRRPSSFHNARFLNTIKRINAKICGKVIILLCFLFSKILDSKTFCILVNMGPHRSENFKRYFNSCNSFLTKFFLKIPRDSPHNTCL